MVENNTNKNRRPKVKTFYAASKAGNMGAFDLSFNSKDGAVYLKMASQTDYRQDASGKGVGVYDWKNSVNVKLDTGEVGGIIRALRTDGEFEFIHNFNGATTRGNIKFYRNQKTNVPGFGFSVKKGDREVKVPVPVGDGEVILEYLRFALDHIFSADYAADKKYWEERAKNKPEVKTAPDADDVPNDDAVPAVADDDNPF